jgi:hypothetical protein
MTQEYYFDEEHTQSFACSRECAERFECKDKMTPYSLFYFLWRYLKHHNVRDEKGEWTTYFYVPDFNDEILEEDIMTAYNSAPDAMYFTGPRLFNSEDRYGSGWNLSPEDYLKANGFDPAMADDPSFTFLHHESDYC